MCISLQLPLCNATMVLSPKGNLVLMSQYPTDSLWRPHPTLRFSETIFCVADMETIIQYLPAPGFPAPLLCHPSFCLFLSPRLPSSSSSPPLAPNLSFSTPTFSFTSVVSMINSFTLSLLQISAMLFSSAQNAFLVIALVFLFICLYQVANNTFGNTFLTSQSNLDRHFYLFTSP